MKRRIAAPAARVWLALVAGIWLLVVSSAAMQVPAPTAPAATERQIDFNWDVRPILSDSCFRCHGPDEKNRRANLRLDTAEGAYAALRRPGTFAVVPVHPESSELIRRVTAENAAVRMPPASTNKILQPDQIEILRKWIEQGAKYKTHWAFITPTRPSVTPVIGNAATGRRLTDIDRFIQTRLQRDGLTLSPQADKETLINRVTLTLTGLPPTLADVDAFLKDTSPNAYEKVVDRLLASPAYAEHMAEYWLNIARYAESDGFLDDLHDRLFWPYRDWVISAFSRNMPFDQFSTWQLAGDLMPSHTKEQVLATAFLRVGKRTTENGAIDEEYRVEYAIDRATTVGVGFLGMTVGCARCHDHKYDPIPTKDFYSLTGVFNSTDEPGYYAMGRFGVAPGPTLAWADAATDAKIAALQQAVAAKQAAFDAARTTAAREALAKADALTRDQAAMGAALKKAVETDLVAHYPFDEAMPVPDDKLPQSRPSLRPSPPALAPESLAGRGRGAGPAQAPPAPPQQGGQAGAQGGGRGRGLPSSLIRDELLWSPSVAGEAEPAYLQSAILKDGVKGKAFYFDDTNRGILGQNVGQFERTQPFSVDLWITAAAVYDDSTIFNQQENDQVGNAGYALHLEKNRLRFSLMHSRAGNRIQVISNDAVPTDVWTHVTVTYDGTSKARGIALYVNGKPVDVTVVSDNLTRTTYANGGGTLGDEFLGFAFGRRFRITTMKDGALDELRLYRKTLSPAEIRYLHSQVQPLDVAASRQDIADVLAGDDSRVTAALKSLLEARDAENQLVSVQPQIMVMGDTPTPRPTYVLVRGQYTDHGEQVPARGLDQVFTWDPSLPPNRVGLARWLFDPKHPLTSRVFVNRMWQMHLGRGIVETSEDFGSQGSIPTHPELLDYLAVSFVESGWDVKKLHKMIVISETYRQRSDVTDELMRKDPRNFLLARYTRVRMPAELVRDSALAASGLLVTKVGGPSAYPYQPPTIWDGFSVYSYPDTDRVPADSNHRRSMYSFIKRNAPHPAMAAFDMPDRGTTSARRNVSNTPLQALVLLDDPQYLEAYRALATKVLKTESARDAQITMAFRLGTRRKPTAAEMTALRSYYDAQLARYAQDKESASQLIKAGVTPVDSTVDPVRLAALMNVTTVIMNTPDAYSLR
ncbi:MAG: DUF1553 domain-containing protein [Acidobacteria bacterium]|nr:DUF1553 domain-containing protein [Acidobacteriota bacterium]